MVSVATGAARPWYRGRRRGAAVAALQGPRLTCCTPAQQGPSRAYRAARMRFLDRTSFACLLPTVAPHPQIDLVEAAAVSTVAAHECGTGAAGHPRCYSRCGATMGQSGGVERVAGGAAAAAGRKQGQWAGRPDGSGAHVARPGLLPAARHDPGKQGGATVAGGAAPVRRDAAARP